MGKKSRSKTIIKNVKRFKFLKRAVPKLDR